MKNKRGSELKARVEVDILEEPVPLVEGEPKRVVWSGKVVSHDASGQLLVELRDGTQIRIVKALSAVPSRELAPGCGVAVVFLDGEPSRPLVIGALGRQADLGEPDGPDLLRVRYESGRLVLEATEEIQIRCGKAEISLRKNGRVIVRGTDILSRSSGRSRIKGASVEIN